MKNSIENLLKDLKVKFSNNQYNMRINRYDEFIKEAKTQGKMMIFYSNEFREILLNIVKYQIINVTCLFYYYSKWSKLNYSGNLFSFSKLLK